jgi:hypothetical protein
MGCFGGSRVAVAESAPTRFDEASRGDQAEDRQGQCAWLGDLIHANRERETRGIGEKVSGRNDRADIALVVGVPAVKRDAVVGRKGFEPVGLAGEECRPADSGECCQLTECRSGQDAARPNGRAGHAGDFRRNLQGRVDGVDNLLVGVSQVELVQGPRDAGCEIHCGNCVHGGEKVAGPGTKIMVIRRSGRYVVERYRRGARRDRGGQRE